jgi:hypothetical protein
LARETLLAEEKVFMVTLECVQGSPNDAEGFHDDDCVCSRFPNGVQGFGDDTWVLTRGELGSVGLFWKSVRWRSGFALCGKCI